MKKVGHSLRNSISPHYFLNEIRQIRNVNKMFSILLTEGETDKRLFKNFIDNTSCYLISANGKDNVINGITKLESMRYEGILGIVDNDFDLLEGIKNKSSNVFNTYMHDLEILMINSPAFNRLINEYTNETLVSKVEKDHSLSLLNLLFNLALPIGYLRWGSIKFDWNLNFGDLPYEDFIDSKSISIDTEKLIDILIRSSFNKRINKLKIFNGIDDLSQISTDPYIICNGHDVLSIFTLLFVYKNRYRREDMEAVLRACYNFEFFKTTSLYKDLINWEIERKYPLFNIKSSEEIKIS
jgi:hypothetical protein